MQTNPEIKSKLMEITPDVAKKFLTRNTRNRDLRERLVESYANDMRNGNWLVNHQGIAFNENGDLIDGQHRLHAVVKSGVTVWMFVVKGLSDTVQNGVLLSTMDTVDAHKPRSVADHLSINHGLDNSALQVATARMVVDIVCGYTGRITTPQAVKILTVYGKAIQHVVELSQMLPRLRSAPILGAFAFAYTTHPAQVDSFVMAFYSGADLKTGSPVLTLRNHMLHQPNTSRNSTTRSRVSEIALNALYQYVTGAPWTRVSIGAYGNDFFAQKQKSNIAKIAEIFTAPVK